jgi:hypothetical protein
LFRRVEGFAQVVAVDKNFEVFSRAWCVAELVEADGLAIPQYVTIYSHQTLHHHYNLLAAVDVQNCQASRPEDKASILGNIDDIGAFNERLQWLIFGTEGLFCTWMDGRDRAKIVGRIASRASVRIPYQAHAHSPNDDIELVNDGSDHTNVV